jgi:hypothetical protein
VSQTAKKISQWEADALVTISCSSTAAGTYMVQIQFAY